MSASLPSSAIFLTDTYQQVKSKISSSFSGGRRSKEEHRLYGGDTEVDIPYQLLPFFLEDDEELATIGENYKSGKMLSSEVKKRAIEVVSKIVEKHQQERAKISDEIVEQFMRERPLLI